MSTVDYIRREFAAMRQHIAGIVAAVPVEAFTWAPPGTANAIGATLVHMTMGEDLLIQRRIQGLPACCDADGWQQRIGIPALPRRGHEWRGIDLGGLDLAALGVYLQDVAGATGHYLETISDADLAQPVDFYGQPQPLGQVLSSIIIHNISHAGEIAALVGVWGTKGRRT
jgi:uncharacterized damage-inducible protein DinB